MLWGGNARTGSKIALCMYAHIHHRDHEAGITLARQMDSPIVQKLSSPKELSLPILNFLIDSLCLPASVCLTLCKDYVNETLEPARGAASWGRESKT